ncbi:VOC family protein [soil metagenome]
MKISGVHHVALICSDYERSKKFYSETLGFPIIAETYRAERQSYKLDLAVAEGFALELFSFPEPPSRPNAPEACGLRHLAFAVANIEETVAELEGLEIRVEPIRVDALTGGKYTFFADPDGLPLELYQR